MQRLFKTFDTNGNGLLDIKEFSKAMKDFQLGLEDQDIQNIFKSFDRNGDGVLDLSEFNDLLLGNLSPSASAIVNQAFEKLDTRKVNFVLYEKVKDVFDAQRHPEVASSKKQEEEVLGQFLETIEMHHNMFNNYSKSDKMTRNEFMAYYRIISAMYEDESSFMNMIKGVWNVKYQQPGHNELGSAGGKEDAQSSRDRYQKANMKGTPFGTGATDQWQSSA